MDITQPTAEKEGVATQNVPTWTLGESRAWFPAPACPPDFGMMVRPNAAIVYKRELSSDFKAKLTQVTYRSLVV